MTCVTLFPRFGALPSVPQAFDFFTIFTTESLQQTPKATPHPKGQILKRILPASSRPLSRIHRAPLLPPEHPTSKGWNDQAASRLAASHRHACILLCHYMRSNAGAENQKFGTPHMCCSHTYRIWPSSFCVANSLVIRAFAQVSNFLSNASFLVLLLACLRAESVYWCKQLRQISCKRQP